MMYLTKSEWDESIYIDERRNEKLRKINAKPRLSDNRKKRLQDIVWETWANEVEYFEEYPQKRTLRDMSVNEIYNDAYAMIHRRAHNPKALTVNSATWGPVDAKIVRHLDALDAAKETEKVAHLYELLERAKNEELDPAEIEKYSDYPIYLRKGRYN